MVEDIWKIISSGLETYTRNLNLCIPFILNMVIIALVALIIFIFSLILFFSSISINEYQTPEAMALALVSIMSQHVLEIAVLVLVAILIILFISAYFTAGAIGMAKQATETGTSAISMMMETGKKNAVNLYLADILVLLLVFAGIVFMVPGAMSIDFSHPSKNEWAGLLFLIGFLLWMAYLMILGLAVAVFRYALVIDSLGPVEAVIKGFDFSKKNVWDVVFLSFIIAGAAIVLSIADNIIAMIPAVNVIWFFVSLIIFLCFLNPVITIWWVRLYMARTGRQVYVNDLLAHPNDLPKN